MIALTLSVLLLGSLISMYLIAERTNAMQTALIHLQQNTRIAAQLLRLDVRIGSFKDNSYFIKNTGRKNTDGTPVYSLYRKDIKNRTAELVEGVEDMKIKTQISGVTLKLIFVTPAPAAIKETVYVDMALSSP
jgi:hypothetical protein